MADELLEGIFAGAAISCIGCGHSVVLTAAKTAGEGFRARCPECLGVGYYRIEDLRPTMAIVDTGSPAPLS